MKKRIISAVAAICLVLSSAAALPRGVFDTSAGITASAVSSATSGTCGENLTWTLSDGVLTISGTGAMTNYNNYNESPFYGRTDIQSVVIKSGVTSIGEFAFFCCTGLTSITIPSGVKSIGRSAFEGCTKLKSVNIPNSVTSIGGWAFAECESLESLTLPSSLEEICQYTFVSCKKLKSVTIPNNVKTVGFEAFGRCDSLQSVTIPGSVESIEPWAFSNCPNLTSVTISNGVKTIDYNAFSGCTNLKRLTIPDSVTRIGSNAFESCENLTSITLPNSIDSIYLKTFMCCYSLESVTLPDSITGIYDGAFYGCKKLKNINIPNSVKHIDTYAFKYSPNLTRLTIPSSVESIGKDAIDKECTIICEKGSKAEKYAKDNGLDYNYSDGDYLYKELADGNVEITGYTGKASALSIPSTLGGKKVTQIGKEAFFGFSSLKRVTVPKSVTSIGEKALGYYDDNGTTKKVDRFMICCEKSSAADTYAWNNGFDRGFIEGDYIYQFLGKSEAMIVGYTGSEANITIPSQLGGMTVALIHAESFKNCTSLKSVTIPDCVEGIGDSAFSSCTNLKSITLPNQLDCISRWLFDGCTSLEKITIPSSAQGISRGAFYGCTSLTSVTIKGDVKYLDTEAFEDCTSLKSITIPGSVTSIGYYVFKNCTSLTSVTIKGGVKTIGNYMFDGCSKLSSVSIPDSVTTIGPMAFMGCTSLKSVTIPRNVTSIGDRSLGYYIDTKTGGTKKVEGFTIYGKNGTAAKTYAKENGFKFVALLDTTRLAGPSRFDTAVEISKAGFPSGANTVVLAYGMNYADALAGVSLAKAMNAPILLTNLKELPQETLAEIKRLKATNVVILGGPGAVGTEVEKALTDNNLTVERIAGASRFETATKIAEKMQKLNKDKAPEDVFFVYYNGFADALSVSTVAAAKGAPVIYLQTNGELDDATAAYLASVKGKVKNAYVIGGDGVISDVMMNKAGTALGLTPTRVFGADRFATCVAVNEKFANVLNGNSVCVATGMDFPDALAGGVFAALNKAPLFLINGKENPLKLSDSQKTYLGTKEPQKLYVFGGEGAVPDSHVQTVADACG